MKSIKAQLEAIAGESMEAAQEVVKRSYFRVFNAATIKSPVDTGMFAASWFFSESQADSTVGTNANRDSVGVLRIDMNDFNIYKSAYFVNNMPYAIKLEYGHSTQAPSGMVRLAAAQFPAIAQEEINRSRLR